MVAGLLASLGCVLGLAFLFFVVYRRHLRRLRRRHSGTPGGDAAGAEPSLPFQVPQRWMTVRSANTGFVRELLGVADEVAVPWAEALGRAREPFLFVSAPLDGWTLVVGGRLPDPAQDIDALYRFLHRLSRELGEVQFYSSDRVVHTHAWARLDDGQVTRAYAWAGETQWNEGRPMLEERLLGLRCREYFEEQEPVPYGEVSPEVRNAERVVLLSRRWSLDPVAASHRLLRMEGVRSKGGDGPRG